MLLVTAFWLKGRLQGPPSQERLQAISYQECSSFLFSVQRWDMNVINFFGVASFSKKPEKYGQGIGLWAFFEKWYDQFSGGGGVAVAASLGR